MSRSVIQLVNHPSSPASQAILISSTWPLSTTKLAPRVTITWFPWLECFAATGLPAAITVTVPG